MSEYVEGVVGRLYKGHRLAIKDPDTGEWSRVVVVGSRIIRKSYKYIIMDANGVRNTLDRRMALRLMEKGEIKVCKDV